MDKSKSIKVKIIYRNYRPLHSMFSTYAECPPKEVEFSIPAPQQHGKTFAIMYRVYNKFGDLKLMQWALAHIVDPLLFGSRQTSQEQRADIYHYLNMIPPRKTKKPYVIEFEHVGALYGFVDDEKQINLVKEVLKSNMCKQIICSSGAARQTVKKLFEKDFGNIKNKVTVLYPAVCKSQIRTNKNHSFEDGKLKLLFVGNFSYLKGLDELLSALNSIADSANKISLTIISDDATEVINKYPNLKGVIDYHPPKFSKTEILENFFSKTDLFILPTKRDTFGFAIIDALTCGTPVISTNQFAIPEMIDDGKDGFLVKLKNPFLDNTMTITRSVAMELTKPNFDPELANEINKLLKKLLSEKVDLALFSKRAIKKVSPGGKFSAEVRNRTLLDIYKQALS